MCSLSSHLISARSTPSCSGEAPGPSCSSRCELLQQPFQIQLKPLPSNFYLRLNEN